MSLSKQFTRREKVLMLVLALLILFAAYWFGVQQPVSESLEQIRSQQLDVQDQITILEIQAKQLSRMRTELEEIMSQPNASMTPEYDNLQQLMVFLNTITGSTSNYSLSFQPVQIPAEAPVPEDGEADAITVPSTSTARVVRRTVSMSFTCPSYAAARSVIESLRDCPYRCQLGNLSLSPGSVENAPAGTGAVGNLALGPVQVQLSATFFEAL